MMHLGQSLRGSYPVHEHCTELQEVKLEGRMEGWLTSTLDFALCI